MIYRVRQSHQRPGSICQRKAKVQTERAIKTGAIGGKGWEKSLGSLLDQEMESCRELSQEYQSMKLRWTAETIKKSAHR